MRKPQKRQNMLKLSLILMLSVLIGLTVAQKQTASAATDYPYLIKVNRKMCTVTIYEKNKKGQYTVPVKAMLCSPGWDTPTGTFKTPAKYRWKLLMDNVWGQYSTRITGGILFHSVWYYQKDPSTLSNRQFNKLGTVCSHGCVRLTTEDAKWIYDNCPLGTTVTIYDSNNPGPLGKPKGIKVSEKTLMGYDPTDKWSEGNPYFKDKKNPPRITGAKNKTVSYGKKVDVKANVKAVNGDGKDITKNLKVTIKFNGKTVKKIDTKTAGKYYVTYSVKDSSNQEAKKEVVFTVVDNTKPVIKGAVNIYINDEEQEINRSFVMQSVYATWHGEMMEIKKVKTTIEQIDDTDDLKVYSVNYKVKAPNGKTAEKSKKVYVDLQAPELTGVSDRQLSGGTAVDESLALEGVKVVDNLSTKDLKIKVTIKQLDTLHYEVTYTVSDKGGNKTVQKVTFTVSDLKFEGIIDRTIEEGMVLTEEMALEGVKAYNKETEITDQIQVTISGPEDGSYTVTYTIADEDGVTMTETCVFTITEKEVTE